MKRLVYRGRNSELVEFDEEIVPLIEAEAHGVNFESGEIFRAKMEVTTCGHVQPVTEALLQRAADAAHTLVVEVVVAVGVWSGDDVGNAVGDGVFGHGHRVLKLLRPVVHSRSEEHTSELQ